ncbi:hypothetical protein NCAS_0B08000 [Naumovozyma castellii]|uniref:Redox protein FMP46, mitochondrial n=1 Tax=Naumovozyma castellii TaxID=27288 RepID=G0VAF4_NAUCA|nr:hypothetical protein NCAS_0B08000 [Naumovozyma castellii CBS 4309]CCC68884.1 hypothetical protein NCAS_0B08000 [Naumovozyma castellii CBS 4309]
MSLFRTIQKNPRTISLFCDSIENNKSCSSILQFLKADTSNKFNVELVSTFPTLDQLKYIYGINPIVSSIQVNHINGILKLKSFDPLFGSSLHKCVKSGVWNPNVSLWVDWEKKCIGNDLKSIQDLFKINL